MGRSRIACLAVLGALLCACDKSGAGAASTHRSSTTSPTTRTPASVPITSRPPATPAKPVALIDHVRWTTNSKGRQLQVFPTPTGRTDDAPGAQKRAWAQVLADAPHAGTAGMYDQFLCHWNYARLVEPDKPSWNLEPWRPVVGYRATVAALCNPGGSEG